MVYVGVPKLGTVLAKVWLKLLHTILVWEGTMKPIILLINLSFRAVWRE